MNETDIKLLEVNGWTVECESPFEIRHEETGSRATGCAAELVLDSLRDERLIEDTIITKMAEEYVDGINRKDGDKDTIHTLFDYGSLGLKTPKELISDFYYIFKNYGLI